MFTTGLLVYYPSAWLYNVSPSLPEQQPAEVPQITINNTDETHNFTACNSNTNNNDERVKEADDVRGSGVIIQTTWGVGREEEGVIIVNELSIQMSNNRHVPQEEEASTMNDEIIAIEILDTILDAASEEDLREMSDVEIEQVMNIMESSDDNQTPERFNREEIEAEIDAILKLALAQVAKLQSERDKINIASNDEIETENVFQNQTFLSHLNDLIANKSSSPIKVSTSKTLGRKQSTSTVGKVLLKHSYSLTDLTKMLDSEANADRNFRNFDEKLQVKLDDEKLQMPEQSIVPEVSKIPTPPPQPKTPKTPSSIVFNFTSLPEKASEKINNVENSQKSSPTHVHENGKTDTVSDEEDDDEAVNKVNIRDKLEKLLQSAPSRFSRITPVPLPRTSVNNTPSAPETPSKVLETPQPETATMHRQKMLFSEVLKNLKHDNEVA